jgi:hypothetical protein
MVRAFAVPLSAALVLAVVPASALAQTATGSFERTLKVTGPVEAVVVSGSGDIVVRSGGDGTVLVRGRISAGRGWAQGDPAAAIRRVEEQPPIVQEGNTIRIGELGGDTQHVSIDYDITVPAVTTLKAKSGSGDVSVEGLSRDADLSSGSGDLHASRLAGAVSASTGSGDVRLESTGAVRISTGSGDIVAVDVKGAATAKTGSGEVRLELAGTDAANVSVTGASGDVRISGARGTLTVQTASGDVSVEGAPGGAWSVTTASGDVTLSLPAAAAFSLDARSTSGHIESSAPVTMTGTTSGHEMRGEVRGGGPRLELRTVSGSISIR